MEELIEFLNYQQTSSSVMSYSLLQRIRTLLAIDWTVEIMHTYREANKC
jgi:hypothetical protein